MGVSATDELAKFLGGLSKEQKNIKENIVPDEIDSSFLLAPFQAIELASSVIVYGRTLSNVLTVGHPVYGVVGSGAGELSFPLTFPLTFEGGGSEGYPVFVPIILGHPIWGVLGSGYLSGDVAYAREVLYETSF